MKRELPSIVNHLKKMYKKELKDWEAAINHFLETGKSFNH